MKRTRISLVFCFVLAFAVGVQAQTPASKPADPTTTKSVGFGIKDTAASQTLVDLAKSEVSDKAAMNTKFQQARGSLDQNVKALNDELKKTQKDLNDRIKADKKYSSEFAHIDDLQKQIQTANQTADDAFRKDAGPLQQKLQTEIAQIDGLVKVVKKENDLPDSATFSDETQKWTVPSEKK